MSTELVRVGLIGAGYAGAIHASRLQRCVAARVVGVCDPLVDRAEALAGPLGARSFSDYREIGDVDCLYICTPPHQHAEIVRFALENRTPFLLEKPLAPDLATANALADALRPRPVITAVGYQWRYRADVDAVRTFLEGRPILLANLRWIDTRPSAPWWGDVGLSGGQVIEQATHLLDLARVFLGEACDLAAAAHVGRTPMAQLPDTTAAHLAFRSGALATLMATCAAHAASQPSLELLTPYGSVTIYERAVTWSGEPPLVVPPPIDPYLAETEAFIAAVASCDASPIRVDFDEALRSHALACGVQAAAAAHIIGATDQ